MQITKTQAKVLRAAAKDKKGRGWAVPAATAAALERKGLVTVIHRQVGIMVAADIELTAAGREIVD